MGDIRQETDSLGVLEVPAGVWPRLLADTRMRDCFDIGEVVDQAPDIVIHTRSPSSCARESHSVREGKLV
jgi:hypothetical protein